jgi:hypothetical protein
MTQKTRPTKSTLPRAIPKQRRCTEMLMRWSPSGLNLQSSPAVFGLYWSTWASPRSGWVEFKAIAEIFFGSRVLCQHKGPAFRTSHSDAVVDAAWQAITLWVRSNKSRLQMSVHYLLPYRKKDQFMAYGVKRDIPRMEMVHHQDVAVELSTRLLTTQHEIKTLRIQLRNADATI